MHVNMGLYCGNSMKKIMLVCGFFVSSYLCAQQEFVITTEKKKVESRDRLKEAIACSAGDLLKQATNELKNQACVLGKTETSKKDVAAVVAGIAHAQELLFTVIQELIECDGDDRWAHASKKELAHTRDVFKQLVVESAQSNKEWWQSCAQTIEDALPTRN